MEFLLGVLIIALLVRLAFISARLRDVERSLEGQATRSERQIRELSDRITLLESARQSAAVPKPAPETNFVPTVPLRIREVVQPPPLPLRFKAATCRFCGRTAESGAAICLCGAALDTSRAAISAEPVEPPPLPEPVRRPASVFASVAAEVEPEIPARACATGSGNKSAARNGRRWSAGTG